MKALDCRSTYQVWCADSASWMHKGFRVLEVFTLLILYSNGIFIILYIIYIYIYIYIIYIYIYIYIYMLPPPSCTHVLCLNHVQFRKPDRNYRVFKRIQGVFN